MCKYYEKRVELTCSALSRQFKEKAEHEAGNYVYDESENTKDYRVSSDTLIDILLFSLNLIHLDIYN